MNEKKIEDLLYRILCELVVANEIDLGLIRHGYQADRNPTPYDNLRERLQEIRNLHAE